VTRSQQPFGRQQAALAYELRYVMDTEKLIEEVKLRPILFEATSKSYKDAQRKERAWKEVADAIDCPG
jgi:Alcohol dehydrogenase transcription factor Myb/SANT-like